MWVYWQGVRVHIEHNVHARELDFLVKDDLVRREVTMVHFSNSKCLLMTYLEPDISSPSVKPKGSLMDVISEAASSALFETHLKHPHGL